jgi:hypothetical protein
MFSLSLKMELSRKSQRLWIQGRHSAVGGLKSGSGGCFCLKRKAAESDLIGVSLKRNKMIINLHMLD